MNSEDMALLFAMLVIIVYAVSVIILFRKSSKNK